MSVGGTVVPPLGVRFWPRKAYPEATVSRFVRFRDPCLGIPQQKTYSLRNAGSAAGARGLTRRRSYPGAGSAADFQGLTAIPPTQKLTALLTPPLRHPRSPQEFPRVLPGQPTVAQDVCRGHRAMVPNWAPNSPRKHRKVPKYLKISPKRPTIGLKMCPPQGQNRLKTHQEGRKSAQERPKGVPRVPKNSPEPGGSGQQWPMT
jgi:hypothetical protein